MAGGIFGSILIDISAKVANLEAAQRKSNAALKKIQRDARRTTKSLKSIDAQAKKTGIALNKAFRISKVVFLAAGALRVFRATWDTLFEGAKSQQAIVAFESIVKKAGGTITGEFDKIQRASKGILSETAIRQATNVAASLGIPLEKVAGLMEIAQAKSRDMGTTLTEAFTDIAKGIGRGSRLILDNLGIILRIREANVRYAKILNKSVAALNDYEKRQAILNAVIEQGSEALGRYSLNQLTSFENLQKMSARADDAWKSFSRLASEVVVGSKGFAILTEILEKFSAKAFDMREIDEAEELLKEKRQALADAIKGGPGFKIKEFVQGAESIDVLTRSIDQLEKRIVQLKQKVFSIPKDVETKPPPQDPTSFAVLKKRFAIEQAAFNLELARNKLTKARTVTDEGDRNQVAASLRQQLQSEQGLIAMKQRQLVQLNAIKGEYADYTDKLGEIERQENQINNIIVNRQLEIENIKKKLEELQGIGAIRDTLRVDKENLAILEAQNNLARDLATTRAEDIAVVNEGILIQRGYLESLNDVYGKINTTQSEGKKTQKEVEVAILKTRATIVAGQREIQELRLEGLLEDLEKVDRRFMMVTASITRMEAESASLSQDYEIVNLKISSQLELLEGVLAVQKKINLNTEEGRRLWDETAADIDHIKARLIELGKEELRFEGTSFEGLIDGFNTVEHAAFTAFERGERIALDTADAMSKAFEDGFFTVMQGKFEDLGDVAEAFLHDIQRMISSILAEMLRVKIAAGIGSILTSAAGGASPAGIDASGGNIAVAHSGGSVTERGIIPRIRESRGKLKLATDEVPAILQTGEEIVSREEVKRILSNEKMKEVGTRIAAKPERIEAMETKIAKPEKIREALGTKIAKPPEFKRELTQLPEERPEIKEVLASDRVATKVARSVRPAARQEQPESEEPRIPAGATPKEKKPDPARVAGERGQEAAPSREGDSNNTFIINTIDPVSFQEYLQRNGGAVAAVITNDLKRNGAIRNAIRNNL
jgi:hypothetical protein